MKNSICILIVTFVLTSCGSKKSLETIAPFTLGEAFVQKWTVEDRPAVEGLEVIISIVSLSEDDALLKTLYFKGKMAPVKIELKEIGMVAIAEFGAIARENRATDAISPNMEHDVFPFELTETQAVISYVQNKKVRYYRIDGIRQNPPVSYPTDPAKMKQ